MNNDNLKDIVNNVRESLSQLDSIKDKYKTISEIILSYDELFEESFNEIHQVVERAILSIGAETSILTPYLDDDSINEIMVNGPKDIFVEKFGVIEKVDGEFFDNKELEDLIRRIGSSINREINENSPILDARLKDGSRVNGIYKNLTGGNCVLTIRKFNQKSIDMDKLIGLGTISGEAAEFLKNKINQGVNMFISGGTSSGKTTMLSALVNLVDKRERIITVEDSRELSFSNMNNVVQLECRQVNSWSGEEIGLDKLIKASLRMRPDRLIVGEIRDGKALINMISGLNTGHSGLSTGHGNSIEAMIKRMEAFYMQESNFPIESIDEQLATAINIMIHMSRDKEGNRYVEEIGQLYLNDAGRIGIKSIFRREGNILEKI